MLNFLVFEKKNQAALIIILRLYLTDTFTSKLNFKWQDVNGSVKYRVFDDVAFILGPYIRYIGEPHGCRLLAHHWERLKKMGRDLPKHLSGDAGDGSEPNDSCLREQEGLPTLTP
ncbi:hypothetical protein [Alteribacillus persepolensis]|uniref:hypothetical protein n=1 Tax=Alteribacillus persepolensis TaxID=568899 RepID=UPI000B89808F|nr:hypothetical protein [Alteribacillus persepolensis]